VERLGARGCARTVPVRRCGGAGRRPAAARAAGRGRGRGDARRGRRPDLLRRRRSRSRALRRGTAPRDRRRRAGTRPRRAGATLRRARARHARPRDLPRVAGAEHRARRGPRPTPSRGRRRREAHKHTPGTFADHDVAVAGGTKLGSLLGDRAAVKSHHHHQGFGRVGEGLVESAHAEDGTLKAVEDPDKRFALGVLWHPEASEDAKPGGGAVYAGAATGSSRRSSSRRASAATHVPKSAFPIRRRSEHPDKESSMPRPTAASVAASGRGRAAVRDT
jgi:hypothetical protein